MKVKFVLLLLVSIFLVSCSVCEDSDGGNVPQVYGSAGSSDVSYDKCKLDGLNIVQEEYTCQENNVVAVTNDCSGYCKEGICVGLTGEELQVKAAALNYFHSLESGNPLEMAKYFADIFVWTEYEETTTKVQLIKELENADYDAFILENVYDMNSFQVYELKEFLKYITKEDFVDLTAIEKTSYSLDDLYLSIIIPKVDGYEGSIAFWKKIDGEWKIISTNK